MASVNATACLSAVDWEDKDYYLNDFCQKYSLPQVAKITKGHYLNVGVPSLTNPSLNQMVLLAQSGKRLKVAAQCVKFKDSSRVVPVGTKLAIPDNYEGWFEILSEDGKAVRCIESVLELLNMFPDSCLVRDNVKAYLPKADNSQIISDKTRTVYAGETLVLINEVNLTTAKSKVSGRYLQCYTTKGETLFFSIDQKGKFSPVAREENISGVHTIKNLILKRFPLMVRLVRGPPPTGVRNNSHFVAEMRLYSLFEEESIMALPLQKDTHLVALPPSAQLKVQAPKDVEALMKLKNYSLLVDRCKNLVMDSSDKIQVFDISMSKELRGEKAECKKGTKTIYLVNRIQRSISDPSSEWKDKTPDPFTRDNFHNNKCSDIPNSYDEIDQIYDYIRGLTPLPLKAINCEKQGNCGNVSAIPNLRSTPSSSATTANSTKSSGATTKSSGATTKSSDATTKSFDDDKPEPPPIETIPVRRTSKSEIPPSSPEKCPLTDDSLKGSHFASHIYETLERNTLETEVQKNNPEKLFIPHPVNNGISKFLMKSPAQQRIQHRTKFFKHSKSSPNFRDVPIQKACQRQRTTRSKSLIASPLFNMRYKSLVNLSSDYDTLDSSHSGGDVSFFSGGSHEMLKRRSKLQRPKSLTDLFQDTNRVTNLCSFNNFENVTHGIENRKFIFCHEFEKGKYLQGHHAKRIGTLYL